MVRITISIRWIATPRDHVRFQSTEDILHWYVTRWHHCSQSGVQDLTVVLLECKQDTDMVPFLENVVDFMQRNWANQRFTTMMWEQTENVLDPCWKSPPSYNANNRISLWNVDSANDRGFSTEALETVKLMVDCFWTRVPGANFTIVDPETDFKLRTPHVSIVTPTVCVSAVTKE